MPTHLLATLLIGYILKLSTSYEWALAIGFGVAIDIDHIAMLLKFKRLAPKHWHTLGDGSLMLHSPLQEPTTVLLVAPLSLLLHTAIPLIFWALHVSLDTFMLSRKRPFWPFSKKIYRYGAVRMGSVAEWLLSTAGLLMFTLHLLIKG